MARPGLAAGLAGFSFSNMAFFDLSMGVSGIILGQIAYRVGLWAVFLGAILASTLSDWMVTTLPRKVTT